MRIITFSFFSSLHLIRTLILLLSFFLPIFSPAQSSKSEGMEAKKDDYNFPTGTPRTQQERNQESISINDFRQQGEGDYTAAFKRAMAYAAVHPGTRIILPCDPAGKIGTFFNIREGFDIPSQTVLEGTNSNACFVNYSPPPKAGRNDAVIRLIGVTGVTLRSFTLTTDPKSPAKVGILMIRNSTNGAAGNHVIQNLAIQGSYKVAAVYSISSEENFWLSNTMSLMGGGAASVFYTADQDNYRVCEKNCQRGSASNLSLWMIANHIINYQSNSAGVTDVLSSSGVGDHSFQNMYIGLRTNANDTSAGFIFEGPRSDGGTNSSIQILSSRVENGSNFARFTNGAQTNAGRISHLSVRDNSYASSSATTIFYSSTGVLLDGARFSNNTVSGSANNSSSFDKVTNSTFDEDSQTITIRTFAQNNRFFGTSQMLVPAGHEDSNLFAHLPSASYSGRFGVMKPGSGLQLRPAGTGDGSAWGASLNLPNGCCGEVPYSKPRTGDVFAEDNQPFYYDGAASRPILLGNVSSYSQLSGNPGNKPQPGCSQKNRGQFWYQNSPPGQPDHLQVCRKTDAEAYSWTSLF